MKKTYLFFVLLLIVVSNSIIAQSQWNLNTFPSNNVSIHTSPTPDSNWTYPTIFNWNYENNENPTLNGTVGAIYFKNIYYFNRFNSTLIYRYNGGWDGPSSFLDSIFYICSIKDLTTDGGTYMVVRQLIKSIYLTLKVTQ